MSWVNKIEKLAGSEYTTRGYLLDRAYVGIILLYSRLRTRKKMVQEG